jgi:hypothetical protein
MLLNELLGVKRLQHMSRFDLLNYLAGTSFKPIGHGASATVMTDGTDVYKFWVQDRAYDAFVQYVSKNQSNPWLPKLKSPVKTLPAFHLRHSKMPDRIKWVKLEKLTPIVTRADGHYMFKFSNDESVEALSLINFFIDLQDNSKSRIDNELARLISKQMFIETKLEQASPELYLLAKTAADIGRIVEAQHGTTNDFYSGNMMMRGNQLVITDPIANDTDYKFNNALDMVDRQLQKDPDNNAQRPTVSGRRPSSKA